MGEAVQQVMAAGGDIVHIDVMDGHFVPNISFGPDMVKAIRKLTDRRLDVHLMIAPVDCYIESFAAAGADVITVHPEAGPHLHALACTHPPARQEGRRRAQPCYACGDD